MPPGKTRRGRRLVIVASTVVVIALTTVLLSYRGSSRESRDPYTRTALLAIATRFNNNYERNRVGLVYDRWDATSQAVISRVGYIRRHRQCPTTPGAATVEDASRATQGYWAVDYSISGLQFVDYWHYQHGRWHFNLARSNPGAIALYRLPFRAYARAVGCQLGS